MRIEILRIPVGSTFRWDLYVEARHKARFERLCDAKRTGMTLVPGRYTWRRKARNGSPMHYWLEVLS